MVYLFIMNVISEIPNIPNIANKTEKSVPNNDQSKYLASKSANEATNSNETNE